MIRYLSWFSCGNASATAAKLTLDKYINNVEVLYCDTFAFEHPDNKRFFNDVEKMLGIKIKILKSKKYTDIYDVFNKTKFLNGPNGARCTVELKKIPRIEYQTVDDVHIFGYTYDSNDIKRAERMMKINFDMKLEFPLIDQKFTKKMCHEFIRSHNIEMPMMYKLGYKNNNCIGCVKGGKGYWNKIRVDFPEVFNKMANLEKELNFAITGKYLHRLKPNEGLKHDNSKDMECGMLCNE
jgi:3'-phosphoadenosine 5'-phosphosulfate sulfotransferase (PAPS reductase)/FAD synthetase